MSRYSLGIVIFLAYQLPCEGANLFLITLGAEVAKDEGGRNLTKEAVNGVQSVFLRSASGAYEHAFIFHMLEERANRETILRWLDGLRDAKGIRDEDVLLFFFTFHGGASKEQGLDLWVHDDGKDEGGSLLAEEVRKRLLRMKGQKILLVDSCFSGAAIRKAGRKFDWQDVTVVTASGPNQVGWYSAMYAAVCEAMYGNADANGDGLIQLGEFIDYVPTRITNLSKRWKVKPISHPLVYKPADFNADLVIGKVYPYPAFVNRAGRDWPVSMLRVEGQRAQVKFLDSDETKWLPYRNIRIRER